MHPQMRRTLQMEAAAAQAAKEAQYNALMSGYTMKANTLGKRRHYDEDEYVHLFRRERKSCFALAVAWNRTTMMSVHISRRRAVLGQVSRSRR